MGARFRLKAAFNISGYSPQAQVVLRAMQQYGLILADNGPNWSFWGTADSNWPSGLVQELDTVPASAFQAVDESGLMVDPNSGQARQLGASVNCSSQPGYRMAASDGGVFSFCEPFYGSMGGQHLNAPIVGMAATHDDHGYWLVASDGGIFSYGDAGFHGSTGSLHLNKPIVGMAATPDGGGYWLVASDGGIFSYGDAGFFGSAGSIPLNKPVVGMAATPDGGRLLAGGVGRRDLQLRRRGVPRLDGQPAPQQAGGRHGRRRQRHRLLAGGVGRRDLRLRRRRLLRLRRVAPLDKPVVGMMSPSGGAGYWLVASDGGVFSYNAVFHGSTGGLALVSPIVAMG